MAPLSPDSIQHIRQTWPTVAAISPQASALFYDTLFIAHPNLVPLFKANMSEQGDKLMQMLSFAVTELDNPDSFIAAFEALGRRHAGYGVQNAHYQMVGEALLATLAQAIGGQFTPAVHHAWATLYETIANIMMSAATEASPQRTSSRLVSLLRKAQP